MSIEPGEVQSVEIEFERRGDENTTYPLHGQIVGVDPVGGTIQILRTRSHAGEVHKMGLRYFLRATAPNCEPFINSSASARLQADLQKSFARESAIEQVKMRSGSGFSAALSQSIYLGIGSLTQPEYPPTQYLFADKVDQTRKVGILARSVADATQFMASQDLFMTLDESLQLAISGHVLWPAGIAYERLRNPDSWKAPWLEIFKALDGLAANTLTFYLQKIRGNSRTISNTEAIGLAGTQALRKRGLLVTEGIPDSYKETIQRIPVAGLKDLLRSAGAKPKVSTRFFLEEKVLSVMSDELHRKALKLMSAPKTFVKAPCGLTNDEFAHAISEMRDSIFVMRQWLRETYELELEDKEKLKYLIAHM